MKYKTFRNLVVVGGLAAFGLGAYKCGSSSSRQPPMEKPEVAVAALPTPRPSVEEPLAVAEAALPVPSQLGNSYEAYLLQRLGKKTSQDKIKDGLGRGDPKVNVYAEGGRWARAKVDLDRDDKWDEKWWLKNNEILRATAPADDERYGDSQRMGPAAE